MSYCPGPGDQVTWGAPTFHPLDPRTPEYDENEPESLEGWRVYTDVYDVYDENYRGSYA